MIWSMVCTAQRMESMVKLDNHKRFVAKFIIVDQLLIQKQEVTVVSIFDCLATLVAVQE